MTNPPTRETIEARTDAIASVLCDKFGVQLGFTEWAVWRPIAQNVVFAGINVLGIVRWRGR